MTKIINIKEHKPLRVRVFPILCAPSEDSRVSLPSDINTTYQNVALHLQLVYNWEYRTRYSGQVEIQDEW